MPLADVYSSIKQSIVAFVPRYYRGVPVAETEARFPPIVGTGFVLRSSGLIVTNDHVAQAVRRLEVPQGVEDKRLPFTILYLLRSKHGMTVMYFEALSVSTLRSVELPDGEYLGPRPDIAVVQSAVTGLPAMELDEGAPPREGEELATAGFPMGTDALTAPGYLHQLCPTLQKGIVSAISPFWCETPYAIMLNVMVQGGASGSPVFRPDSGRVVGVLCASLRERQEIQVGEPGTEAHTTAIHLFPTNISFVVPAHFLRGALEQLPPPNLPSDLPSLAMISAAIESGAIAIPKTQVVAIDRPQV